MFFVDIVEGKYNFVFYPLKTGIETHELLDTAHKNEAVSLKHVLEYLNDSERDVKVIQMVGDHQLLQVRKHIQHFLKKWPETLKLMKNQRYIADFVGLFFTILRRRKYARTVLKSRGSTNQY